MARKIVVVYIISMWDIYHNFVIHGLVGWLNCLIVKTYFPSYLSFLTLRQMLVVIICICLSVPIILVNMITQSVYPMNPPTLQGGEEEGVEEPKSYVDL